MAARRPDTQGTHDGAVRAAGQIYRNNGKPVWINPDGERNKDWGGFYIDVIAMASETTAWVTEIETEDSVCDSEARSQWKDYDGVYTSWCLAVPVGSEEEAKRLLRAHSIVHCTVITWRWNPDGSYTFYGLPGV